MNLAYFGQNLVAMATFLRSLQSEMSSSDLPTMKTLCYSLSLVEMHQQQFCPEIGHHGNALCSLCTGVSQVNSLIAETMEL